ncbi:MAG: ABC transporter substrate-binding protein [Pseudomonadota bacterium]
MKRLLFALLLVAGPASAEDEMRVILDWFVNPNHGPIIIAEENGYFEDAGLAVEVIAPADPSLPAKLVAAGEADLAISYQQQIHLDVHEGLPIIRVGTLIATPLNCLLVLADGPVQSLSDLKGRSIGFSVAGVDEAIIKVLLDQAGLTLDDVEMVNVNWSLAPSLMSRQVDAVIGAARNFQPNQMSIDGIEGRCFYLEEEGFPAYDELIYVAKSDAIDKDKISRFLGATERATQFIINNPDRAFEIFAQTSPELDDELNKRAWADTLARFAARPAAVDMGRYAAYEKFMADAGLVENVRPASDFAIDVTAE